MNRDNHDVKQILLGFYHVLQAMVKQLQVWMKPSFNKPCFLNLYTVVPGLRVTWIVNVLQDKQKFLKNYDFSPLLS